MSDPRGKGRGKSLSKSERLHEFYGINQFPGVDRGRGDLNFCKHPIWMFGP